MVYVRAPCVLVARNMRTCVCVHGKYTYGHFLCFHFSDIKVHCRFQSERTHAVMHNFPLYMHVCSCGARRHDRQVHTFVRVCCHALYICVCACVFVCLFTTINVELAWKSDVKVSNVCSRTTTFDNYHNETGGIHETACTQTYTRSAMCGWLVVGRPIARSAARSSSAIS